jgi:hypothetical protein
MAVTRASSTRPAITPGEPPTLALAAEAMAIVGIYLAMRGIWRVRRKPYGRPAPSVAEAASISSQSESSEIRERDAA